MMGTVHTFPYDETPTPTRFIRNCEEIGLFHDLQHNPFEETFRIAAASNDIPQLLKDPLTKVETEETLNTPCVIPTAKNDSFHNVYPVSMEDDEDIIILSSEYLIEPEPILPEEKQTPSSENEGNSDPSSDIEIIEEPKHNGFISGFLFENTVSHSSTNSTNGNTNEGFILQKSVISNVKENTELKSTANTSNVSGVPKTVNTTKASDFLYQLSNGSLPAVLNGKNVVILPSKSMPKTVERKCSFQITPKRVSINQEGQTNVKQKLKNLLKNNSSQNMTEQRAREVRFDAQLDTNSMSSIEDEKKEYSRERNRMAQKRCRIKKKRWIMQLKKETECVLSENKTLQVEIGELRAQIAHLKTLLLAHRNCSVTRAMYKADISTIMNNEVCEIAEDIEIPVSDDSDNSGKVQFTYQKQVNNQQINNQINHQHIHVHVPASPEPIDDLFNLTSNRKHVVQPLTVPRQLNVLNSKFGQNKTLICDSKVVPIKPNDRSLNGCYQNRKSFKTNVLTAGNVEDMYIIPEINKKPSLKVFINGNHPSPCDVPINTVQNASKDNSSPESEGYPNTTKVINLSEQFKAGKTNS